MENAAIKAAKKHFSRIGLFLFLGSLIICVVQILASTIARRIPAIAANEGLYFLSYILPIDLIAFPLIFLIFQRIPAQPAGDRKKMSVGQFLTAFLIADAGTVAFNILGNLLTLGIALVKQSPVDNVVQNLVTNINPVFLFLPTVICAPIMEELMYRKIILDRSSHYGEKLSLLFCGLIFGLTHGNLVQFCYAFFLGIFFGFIYLKTRNILYPILLHMMINFLGGFVPSIFSTFSYDYIQSLEDYLNAVSASSDAASASIVMLHLLPLLLLCIFALFRMGCFISGIILFILNRKKFVLTAHESDLEKGQQFKTVILNPGMLLFSIFWIVMIIWQLIR